MLHKDDNTGPWSKIYTLNMRNHKASKQMLGGWKHAPQKNWFSQVGYDLILPFHICDYHFGWPLLSSFEKELKIQILTKKKKVSSIPQPDLKQSIWHLGMNSQKLLWISHAFLLLLQGKLQALLTSILHEKGKSRSLIRVWKHTGRDAWSL